MIDANRRPEGGVDDIPPTSSGSSNEGQGRSGDSNGDRGIRFLSVQELLVQKAREPLIAGVLDRDSLAFLYAKYGLGKTFLALSMGASVAAGVPWFGRRVTGGLVIYVVAEGVKGFRDRVRAVLTIDLGDCRENFFKNLLVLPHAVNFTQPAEFEPLLTKVKSLAEGPTLIVIDTQARCTVGADENSAQHMGEFVKSCDRLREATGATLLVIHHSVKHGEGERGSSSLGGAADTMMEITLENGALTLCCKKQKDGEPFDPIDFRLEQVKVDVRDDGTDVTSCIVKLVDEAEPPEGNLKPETDLSSKKPSAEAKIRSRLRECRQDGATGPDLIAATGLHEATFYRHFKEMRGSGEVEVVPGSDPVRYRLRGNGGDSHSHSHESSGDRESETGHSQSQSHAPVGGETESEAETALKSGLFGDDAEEWRDDG